MPPRCRLAPAADRDARRGRSSVPVMYDQRFAVSTVAPTLIRGAPTVLDRPGLPLAHPPPRRRRQEASLPAAAEPLKEQPSPKPQSRRSSQTGRSRKRRPLSGRAGRAANASSAGHRRHRHIGQARHGSGLARRQTWLPAHPRRRRPRSGPRRSSRKPRPCPAPRSRWQIPNLTPPAVVEEPAAPAAALDPEPKLAKPRHGGPEAACRERRALHAPRPRSFARSRSAPRIAWRAGRSLRQFAHPFGAPAFRSGSRRPSGTHDKSALAATLCHATAFGPRSGARDVGHLRPEGAENSLDLGRLADRLGYDPFLGGGTPQPASNIASSAPDIMIGQIAAATQRMRVGSGGMLPNHAPFMGGGTLKVLEGYFPRPHRPRPWPRRAPTR